MNVSAGAFASVRESTARPTTASETATATLGTPENGSDAPPRLGNWVQKRSGLAGADLTTGAAVWTLRSPSPDRTVEPDNEGELMFATSGETDVKPSAPKKAPIRSREILAAPRIRPQ